MKKKIICIGIISMFLLTSTASSSPFSGESRNEDVMLTTADGTEDIIEQIYALAENQGDTKISSVVRPAIEENKEPETYDATDDGLIYERASGFFRIEVEGRDIFPYVLIGGPDPFVERLHYIPTVWFQFGAGCEIKTAQYGLRDKSNEAHRVRLYNAIYLVTEFEFEDWGWYVEPTKVSIVGFASLIRIGPCT